MMQRFFICIMLVFSMSIQASKTMIASFRVPSLKYKYPVKWFYNQTGQTIKIFWKVKNLVSGEFYAQEPMVVDGEQINIPLHVAAASMPESDHGYQVVIKVSKVLKKPLQKGDEMEERSFRNGKKDLLISSKTFEKTSKFNLLKDKSGRLVCTPIIARF